MDCQNLIRHLSEFIDNELDGEVAEEVRRHIAACPDCHVVLDSTERAIELYRRHERAQRIPIDRRSRLFERLEAALKDSDR